MWNESGVMDEQLFDQWIKQWVPTLLDDHPDVFFIILADNHYSHWSLEACKFLTDAGVDYLTLPSRSTSKSQVCDTILNQPLKSKLRKACSDLTTERPTAGFHISAYELAAMTYTPFDEAIAGERLPNEFARLGLVPFSLDKMVATLGIDPENAELLRRELKPDSEISADSTPSASGWVGSTPTPAPIQLDLSEDFRPVMSAFAVDGDLASFTASFGAASTKQQNDLAGKFLRHNFDYLGPHLFDFLKDLTKEKEDYLREHVDERHLAQSPTPLVRTARFIAQSRKTPQKGRSVKRSYKDSVEVGSRLLTDAQLQAVRTANIAGRRLGILASLLASSACIK